MSKLDESVEKSVAAIQIDYERAPRWRLANRSMPPAYAQCFVSTRSNFRLAFWRPHPEGAEWCDFHTGAPWRGSNSGESSDQKIIAWMNLPDAPSLSSAAPASWSRSGMVGGLNSSPGAENIQRIQRGASCYHHPNGNLIGCSVHPCDDDVAVVWEHGRRNGYCNAHRHLVTCAQSLVGKPCDSTHCGRPSTLHVEGVTGMDLCDFHVRAHKQNQHQVLLRYSDSYRRVFESGTYDCRADGLTKILPS